MPTEIKRLVEGYQEFRQHYFEGTNLHFAKLARDGQKPKILMIACCDSRVDPAIVMNCEPGDLFVVRNVANLVPPYEDDNTYHGTSAALEFGVCGLGIRHIIIFGHTQCGGIQSLLKSELKTKSKSFISKWTELANSAKEITLKNHAEEPLEQQTLLCGQYSLINSLNNLHTFPWIQERVEIGKLFVHAWYFDLKTGVIQNFDRDKNQFYELSLDNL